MCARVPAVSSVSLTRTQHTWLGEVGVAPSILQSRALFTTGVVAGTNPKIVLRKAPNVRNALKSFGEVCAHFPKPALASEDDKVFLTSTLVLDVMMFSSSAMEVVLESAVKKVPYTKAHLAELENQIKDPFNM